MVKLTKNLSVPARLFEAGKQDAISSTPSPKLKKRKVLNNPNLVESYSDNDRPEGLLDFLWIFLISTVVKVLLMPSYRSTDFEVHRNWLAITHSLPMHEWYFEKTSQWTLDYPPLFAYFEWLLSQFAHYFDKDMLVVSNLNYASPNTVTFQRLTVIISDLALLLGILMWSKTWSSTRITECAHSRGKVAVIGGLTFFNPGLLMVDHIHFQYNGFLMGLLLISVALVRMRRNLAALAVFCVLLLMKHIFFYVVPVMGVYLLAHYCWSVASAGQLTSGLERCKNGRTNELDNYSDGGEDADSEESDYFEEESVDSSGDSSSRSNGRRSGFSSGNASCWGESFASCCDDCCVSSSCKRCCCYCCGGVDDDDIKIGGGKKRKKQKRKRTLSEDVNLHVIPGHFKPLHFLALVFISLIALIFAFGPIIASDVRNNIINGSTLNSTVIVHSTSKQMTQIFSRLFPWGRGLCHAYWAPNIWSWYLTVDLVARRAVRILKIPYFQNMTEFGATSGLVQVTTLSVLPNIKPVVTFALTFLFILPVLWKIWKFPHPLAFAHALVYCQMCSFMLGYHVHEKAILMAIVPVGMLAADSVDDAKVYLLMSWVGHISLFPLLEHRRELPSKILFTSIHMLLSYVALDRFHRSEQRAIHIEKSKRGIRFNTIEHLYLCGLGLVVVFSEFLHPIFFVKEINGEKVTTMPFLPLLFMSIYCAIGLIYAWYLSYKQYLSKIKRIMSYAESPC